MSRLAIAGSAGIAAWTSMVAHAEPRPTRGGLWSFDAADSVVSWETADGQVRVHYSVDGPNLAPQTDDDGDGTPDYVRDVAETLQGHWRSTPTTWACARPWPRHGMVVRHSRRR